ncbi:MAG: hypothetical protein ACFFCQ_03195 [Promethearchaeota archaeon]
MSSTSNSGSITTKSIQLLDITALSLTILTIVSGILFLFVVDQFVQNLAPFVLCALLTVVTIGTRLKISAATEESIIRNYLIEWIVTSAFLTLFALFVILFYPMGRNL